MNAERKDLDPVEEDEYCQSEHSRREACSAVSLFPVKSPDDRPEESCFKPAERKEIDPHNYIRRIESQQARNRTDSCCQRKAVSRHLLVCRIISRIPGCRCIERNFLDVVDIQILDDSGRCQNQE